MQFMVLMIPKVYQPGQKLDPHFTPPAEMIEKMTKFNEALAKAGKLIALNGLQPATNAARVRFPGGKPTVTDGPFAEAKEVVGGYWILDFASKQEAVEWMKKCPALEGDVIEIRPIFELSDMPADAQKAGDSPLVKAQLEKNKR